MGGAVDHPKGVTILVLGILSIVCCSPLGIAAYLMGNTALKEIDAQPGRYSNRQIVQIGRILGIVGMVFLVLSVLWVVFFGGLAALTSSSTN
jgi:membrane-anchored glycerophosphoryl diester phosphodiesterase (GDPDase)